MLLLEDNQLHEDHRRRFTISPTESDVRYKRVLVIMVALDVTIWPVAYIRARRIALRQMKQQETTKDFTCPGAVHSEFVLDANSDDTSQLQLQSLDTAAHNV